MSCLPLKWKLMGVFCSVSLSMWLWAQPSEICWKTLIWTWFLSYTIRDYQHYWPCIFINLVIGLFTDLHFQMVDVEILWPAKNHLNVFSWWETYFQYRWLEKINQVICKSQIFFQFKSSQVIDSIKSSQVKKVLKSLNSSVFKDFKSSSLRVTGDLVTALVVTHCTMWII
jgi:hypothetical protein